MRNIRNCNVVVVGGAGFLGSHLVETLIQDRGCKVLVVDNLCVGRREFIHRDAEFHHADITLSEAHLKNVFKAFGAEYVFNYAAWPYIPDSFVRPLHVFAVNATGAMNVINAAQEAGCKGILQVSSAEIYGEGSTSHNREKIGEGSRVAPHSTYGVAKAAVDNYVQTAWKERKTPCIALRQFNCIGERETHAYVVPEIIGQLAKCNMESEPPIELPSRDGDKWKHFAPGKMKPAAVKLGNNSYRDFQYAGDAVRMAVELLEKGEFGEVYNLGSESGVKIYDLAVMIGKAMGFADVTVERDESRVRPWEIWHLQAQCDKLYSVIKSRPQVSLEDALRRTVTWYETNGRKWPWELQRTQST